MIGNGQGANRKGKKDQRESDDTKDHCRRWFALRLPHKEKQDACQNMEQPMKWRGLNYACTSAWSTFVEWTIDRLSMRHATDTSTAAIAPCTRPLGGSWPAAFSISALLAVSVPNRTEIRFPKRPIVISNWRNTHTSSRLPEKPLPARRIQVSGATGYWRNWLLGQLGHAAPLGARHTDVKRSFKPLVKRQEFKMPLRRNRRAEM